MVLVSTDDCYLNSLLLYGVKFWFSISIKTFTFRSWFSFSSPLCENNFKHHYVLMNIFFQFSIIIIYSSYHSFDTQIVPNLTNGTSSGLGAVSFWCVLITMNSFSMAHPDTSGLCFPVLRVLFLFRTRSSSKP